MGCVCGSCGCDCCTSAERPRELYFDVSQLEKLDLKQNQIPIVYSPDYNISFCGLENLHPFDAKKWGHVYSFLEESGLVQPGKTVEPNEVCRGDLLFVHSERYLNSLASSCTVAAITEVPPVCCLPPCIVDKYVLRKFRLHTGGTIVAAKLAVDGGWAINIGGGFHHCSSNHGGGFCVYADITLAIRFLFDRCDSVHKAMIVDLDAHQGNGHETDFKDDSRVYIVDVYNRHIYPHDVAAKRGISLAAELDSYTEDRHYLQVVTVSLETALNEFSPDIVMYNAGTDILAGDPLGALSISDAGIVKRDEIVFQAVRARNIPIVMVTSGGYQARTARIIADSIINLNRLGLIRCT